MKLAALLTGAEVKAASLVARAEMTYAAPASRRVASALRTWSGAKVTPPLVEMSTRARSTEELEIGSVARKYLKLRVALVSPTRLMVGDVMRPARLAPS